MPRLIILVDLIVILIFLFIAVKLILWFKKKLDDKPKIESKWKNNKSE